MLTRTNRSLDRILAIDLGKFKSVACDYHAATGTHAFATVATRPQAMHDLIVERSPDVVVIEVGSQAGWVKDLCESLGVAVRIANPNHFVHPRAMHASRNDCRSRYLRNHA